MGKRYASLAEYLDKTGLRQEDFAAQLGVSQATVSRWVRGDQMPSPVLALKIQDLTGVSVESLMRIRAGAA